MTVSPTEALLFQEALACATAGWRTFSFEAVAARAGCSVEHVESLLVSRDAFLSKFLHYIDYESKTRASLEGLTTLKDQLMELFLVRLELLEPYKIFCREAYEDAFLDPALACTLSRGVLRYVKFIAEICFEHQPPYFQTLTLPWLFGLYLMVFRTWLSDEALGTPATLAFLDRALTSSLPFFQIFRTY